jgi:HSP20 family protein
MRDVEDLFQRFLGEMTEENGNGPFQAWAPRVDVVETDKEIFVKADLPGVDPKDVEITVTDGSLVLRGEKKEEREEKKKSFHRMERFVGKFYREIPLPPGADAAKIVASSGKGVLTVTVPKTPQAQAKKIPVLAKE